MPHLPTPIHAVVRRIQLTQHRNQGNIFHDPGTGPTLLRCPISARSDEPTPCPPEHATTGLDPELNPIENDVPNHLVMGRSSSTTKKPTRSPSILFARRDFASSRLSRRIPSAPSRVNPSDPGYLSCIDLGSLHPSTQRFGPHVQYSAPSHESRCTTTGPHRLQADQPPSARHTPGKNQGISGGIVLTRSITGPNKTQDTSVYLPNCRWCTRQSEATRVEA